MEPRQFSGQLLHQLPAAATPQGEIYIELYLNEPAPENQIGLYRSGTRVLPSLTQLDCFQNEPWASGYFQGIIDAPFLNLTPGTRDGIIQDESFSCLCDALRFIEEKLAAIIAEQRKAQEERSSHHILRSVQKAFKEAFLFLPQEEYDWFEVYPKGAGPYKLSSAPPLSVPSSLKVYPADGSGGALNELPVEETAQKQFFEFAGPLYRVLISPSVCVVPVKLSKNFRAVPRDLKRRLVEKNLTFLWELIEGEGTLENKEGEIAAFTAPAEPGLCRLRVTVRQENTVCTAEAAITVTDSLLPEPSNSANAKKGLPGYTLRRAAGEIWRSRYDVDQNVVVINNAHRDFVFASKNQTRKLRYICRLFTKELVQQNFPGLSSDHLLERMIELSLYTEENLK